METAEHPTGRKSRPRFTPPYPPTAAETIPPLEAGEPVDTGQLQLQADHKVKKIARHRPVVQGTEERNIRITTADSLKAARIAHGYLTAESFAKVAGVKANTYWNHENAKRTVTPEVAAHYAAVLARTQPLLSKFAVPVVGVIGTAPGGTLPGSHMVDLSGLVATIITVSDPPALFAGDVLLHPPLSVEGFDIQSLHERQCVLQLVGGERLVAFCRISRWGTVTLSAHPGADARRRLKADQVEAGAPVHWIGRGQART